MKKAIVTTTINRPTEARAFAAMRGWDFIVVGDTKTPHSEYEALDGCIYLSPEKQESIDKPLSDMLGWKTIQRRNMGFRLRELSKLRRRRDRRRRQHSTRGLGTDVRGVSLEQRCARASHASEFTDRRPVYAENS